MFKKLNNSIVCLITLVLISFPVVANNKNYLLNEKSFAIVTYASDNIQERSVRAMINSLREFGGEYKNSKVFVVLGDAENFPCTSLKAENVILLPIEMNKAFINYPLAIKAYAAAQVEKLVRNEVSTLAWFDPVTIVLNSLENLDLEVKYSIAIRPVTLQNAISLEPDKKPDEYWLPIYTEFGLDYKNLPVVQTVVNQTKIQAYYNCEIFSVDPKLGIFESWAEKLTKFLQNSEYQKNVCNTVLRQFFLHQAVLSGVINSKVETSKIKNLSIKTAYPVNQQENLPEAIRAKSLNDLNAVIFDYTWEKNPAWMKTINVNEPLKSKLINIYADYLKISENIYRFESSCNSYLVTTKDGSVLIDPSGATIASEYFKSVIAKYPLKAILLTHAHKEHWAYLNLWANDPSIPIIAQQDFTKFTGYSEALNEFFERRAAIWARKPIPVKEEIKPLNPVKPTITFGDEYTYELGGIKFNFKHVGGETPDHSIIYSPELSAIFVGDNYYENFINNAAFGGTFTHSVSSCIETLNISLLNKPEYFLMGHGTPIVSKNAVEKTVKNFRDALQYLHDETLKGINEGKDVYALMTEVKIPAKYKVSQNFDKDEWTVRGIYHELVGWFDENPSSMYSTPPSSIYADLVKLAGGGYAIAKLGWDYYNNKEFEKVLHITDAGLKAEPKSKPILDIRLLALKALKNGTNNFIEKIWLDYGIKQVEEAISTIEKEE